MHKYTVKKDELQAKINGLTKLQLEIFNFFIRHSTKYKLITVSQLSIATYFNCSREYVNKIVKRLKGLKLIRVRYRHRTTCIYEIQESLRLLIHDKWVRTLLPAFKNFMFYIESMFYTLFGKKQLEQKFTPYKNKSYINLSSDSNSTIARTTKGRFACDELLSRMTSHLEREKFINKYLKEEKREEKTLQIGEQVMSDLAKPHITPLMRQITSRLQLSKWGQIRLLIYDERSLKYAYDLSLHKPINKSILDWFSDTASRYSITNNIPIQHELYATMQKRFGMPQNPNWFTAPKFEDRPIRVTQSIIQPQSIAKIGGMEFPFPWAQ